MLHGAQYVRPAHNYSKLNHIFCVAKLAYKIRILQSAYLSVLYIAGFALLGNAREL